MTIDLHVQLQPTQTQIQFNQETFIIYEQVPRNLPNVPALGLLASNHQIIQLNYLPDNPIAVANNQQLLLLTQTDWSETLPYIAQLLIERWPSIMSDLKPSNVPNHHRQNLKATIDSLILVLQRFGFTPPVVKPATSKIPSKTRHRWTKEISTIPFQIDTRQATGTAIWQKRNELLLQAGAHLMPEAPLNKDGSLGFAAKMGTQLRTEHATAVQNHQTTTDLIFKSVNELGLFLYFGGTNSWLELLDSDGRSIDDWTKI